MIDLHSHVLPGVDDGPESLQGSLDILRAAAEDEETESEGEPEGPGPEDEGGASDEGPEGAG